jgi:hypothetical protein
MTERATMKMTREELRTFCTTENFSQFQERVNAVPEADALDILVYLLGEGADKNSETHH